MNHGPRGTARSRFPGRFLLVALLCLAARAPALAQEAGTSFVLPGDVLAASREHFPLILQSMADQRGAQGRVLEAEGAFDLVFSVEGFNRAAGFYDGSLAAEGKAAQRFRDLGGEAYAGYKISDGLLPIYEDEYYTNSGGAMKVGMLFSLLRDRVIDRQRFRLRDAEFGQRMAELDVLLTKVGVQQQALIAYWRWVKIGRQLEVYEDLLNIAIERQAGLEEQVRRGALAEIFLVENQQNITRRRTLVTAARRDLMVAANALSFYYRDDNGRPLVPPPERLPPPEQDDDSEEQALLPEGTATAKALARRPELEILDTAIEQVRNEMALAENDLKPRLDLGIELQQPIGSVAEGGISRNSTDAILGLKFSVPLQRRAAKGRIAQAQAELDARHFEQQLQQERIELEVRNILLELTYARELQQLALLDARQSDTMRDAELKRFESGASDFFLVNVREERAANARIALLQAELTTRIARANFDASVVDFQRLGLPLPE
jgi:outer membrane protein TolC